MPNKIVLQQLAENFKGVEEQIKAAEDMIKFMEEAGNQPTAEKSKLTNLKMEHAKWKKALEGRGLYIK